MLFIKKLSKHLYFWVLLGTLIGVIWGIAAPNTAIQLKPLGDAFIALVKMLISPIVFCTIVLGIAKSGDMKKVGRIGGKALLYFEVISTLALFIGLGMAHVFKPGSGFNIDPSTLHTESIAKYTQAAHNQHIVDYLLHIIPTHFIGAFTASGNLLQVLFISILFGYALLHLNKKSHIVHTFIGEMADIFFTMMHVVMKVAPLGAMGAMAFTVGKYGASALQSLASLMGVFYLTCLIFILCVLGTICAFVRCNIFRLIAYMKDELLTVLGTSSSESVLIPLMEKLKTLGCSQSVVGLVVPAGYSFNLDGTNIYLTMAALFVAQALNIELTFTQELTILIVAMLTSKGAAGVAGAGFITLAATLTVIPDIPVAGLVLLLGVDRLMGEARGLTNMIGNGVAAIVIAHWENDLDHDQMRRVLTKN